MGEVLSGRGELKEDGRVIGEAEYKLFISQSNNVRSAHGTLYADPMVLIEAYEATNLTLFRQDVLADIRIIVSSYTPGDFAKFAVDGSPG